MKGQTLTFGSLRESGGETHIKDTGTSIIIEFISIWERARTGARFSCRKITEIDLDDFADPMAWFNILGDLADWNRFGKWHFRDKTNPWRIRDKGAVVR